MAGQAGSQGSKARPGNRRVAQWTRGYARLPGIPDEYLTEDGTPREVWTRFFEAFAELTPADIERRFGLLDRGQTLALGAGGFDRVSLTRHSARQRHAHLIFIVNY